ncbi:MAG: hypothetical protein ABJJ37_26990 [Roseibium sp.]
MPAETKNTLSNARHMISRSVIGATVDDEIGSSIKTSWRRRSNGVLLLIMYALVFYIVMMSLTAYQIQTRVQALAENGQKLSIWGVTRTAGELFKIQDELNKLTKRQLALEDDHYLTKAELQVASSNYEFKKHSLLAKLRLIPSDIKLDGDMDFPILLGIAQENQTELKEVSGGIEALTEFQNAEQAAGTTKYKLDGIQSEINILDHKTIGIENKLRLLKRETAEYDKNVELIDELHFFYYPPEYTSSWIGSVYAYMFGGSHIDSSKARYGFVTLPSEVLMILIVIAMGTMGSLINITQVFFAGEDRKITFYLFRPLLGAVVAIGIYVITKAGVLVSSNVAADSGGVAKLNAFFVSFVSLIAGLMSETAITTIKSSGTRFLRGDAVTETARYANGVKAEMTKDGKENKDLYPFFEVPPDEIDNWLTENELVPSDAQRVIAAWLEKPVRNLFSDMRPPANLTPTGQHRQRTDAEPIEPQPDTPG